jgi:hypothetical protein
MKQTFTLLLTRVNMIVHVNNSAIIKTLHNQKLDTIRATHGFDTPKSLLLIRHCFCNLLILEDYI